ncbi:MAG: GHKL domain-containing protein [Nitrospinae bacterium]|nr:GHKL domain-containing protein [Nitrospinota bacterium]
MKNLVDKFSQLARKGDAPFDETRPPGEGPESLSDISLLELAPAPAPLHDVIEEVVNLYRDTTPGVELVTDLDPAVDLVNIDTEQIKRVFANLVKNAIDAIGEEGTVRLSTKRAGDGRSVTVTVADDGPGVAPEVADRIFRPYVSTKPTGAGLGLAIVARIVEDHGGTVSVTNNDPTGARFTLTLPLG